MDNKKSVRNLILALGVPILIIFLVMMFYNSNSKPEYKYSYILSFFDVESTESTYIESYDLSFETKILTIALNEKGQEELEKEKITYKVPDLSVFVYDVDELLDKLDDPNLDEATRKLYDASPLNGIEFDYQPAQEETFLSSLLPSLIMLGFMVIAWIFIMRRLGSAMGDAGKQSGFGKAKIKGNTDEKRKTTFADVAGADEEKEELTEIVEFLKNPKKFVDLGAHIPKGVLLVGPPGTGKTLLARAVAGEANVPFFSISGSDFVEMFVGVGASRVRDLFEQAKKHKASIVFIDEIDAVGRHRGAGLGGGHDEREQTLNQLLVEMDGFGVNEGVIIIAATNRPDILDPALTRPGRFDRQVTVGYPDIKGREEILKVHARKKPLAPDVDLATIAKSTAGFTGADLENLLNEAALLAARRNLKSITMTEIEEATIKVVVGTEKKSHKMTDKEKKLTAVHEAGHAVVTYFCPTQDPVHQISIIPRGMAGGYTMSLPQEDRSYRVKSEILEDIVVLLGGRAAEAIALDDISTGASNDIERASKLAREMVMRFGMSDDLGPINFASSEGSEIFLGRSMGQVKDYSDEVARQIDAEVKDIITTCYEKAKSLLAAHRDKLDLVSQELIDVEKLDGERFNELMQTA